MLQMAKCYRSIKRIPDGDVEKIKVKSLQSDRSRAFKVCMFSFASKVIEGLKDSLLD